MLRAHITDLIADQAEISVDEAGKALDSAFRGISLIAEVTPGFMFSGGSVGGPPHRVRDLNPKELVEFIATDANITVAAAKKVIVAVEGLIDTILRLSLL
jgi:nucleoid DNA-binding protein